MILLTSEAISDVNRIRSFLEDKNPDAARAALRAIWTALELAQQFPELGRPTQDPDIRQIVVRFGRTGYIVRYATLSNALLVTRIWHGREARE